MKKRVAPQDTAALEFRYGWIGPVDAMIHLGIPVPSGHSPHALYRLILEHQLPFGRLGGKYRFRRADLDAWLAQHGSAALVPADERRFA